MVIGDIDGDGDLDIVVANISGCTVWVNDGAGNFAAHATTPNFGASSINSLAIGDIDGDGDLDLVVAQGGGFNNQPSTVWLNDGAGNFSAHPTQPSFGTGWSIGVALGDIDGDGDLDALVLNTGGQAVTVWLNDGAGAYNAHPTAPSFAAIGGNNVTFSLRDLDGDADLDVVIGSVPGQGTVWLNDGSGSFTPHPTTPAVATGGAASVVVVGDIDGDGDLDAIFVNTAGVASVWRNNGAGSLTPHPTTPSFASGTSVTMALGDLDGDGDLDLVIGRSSGQSEIVWLNDGGGNFTAHPTIPSFGAGDTRTVVLGDIDVDGDLDVVAANTNQQAETVWLNMPTFPIATAASPVGSGTVTCVANPVLQNGSSTCTATANAGFTFASWSGDCTGATCTLTNVTAAANVTANFTVDSYAVATAASPMAGGTVTCTPNPVNHGSGSTCTATPNPGYAFASWSGDCTGATCVLNNVTAASSVTANFSALTYAITTAVNPAGAGTVSCTPNPVGHAGSSTCTATPNAGFALAGWSGDCTGATCTLANVTAAKSVTASFSALTYAITTAVNPAGAGTVSCTPNPVGHAGSSTCTATPNPGFALASWSGDCTGATCTLTNVTSAKSVTASFSSVTYAITTAVNPAGSGTVSCTPNPVGHGGSSSCTPSANPGFAFTAFTGDCSGATCTLTNVTAARSVTANYAAVNRTHTGASATGTGTITATFTGGDATCTFGTAQFIAAPPGSPPVPPTTPADTVFPHGLFDFTTTGCTPGSTITMTITYPSALPAGYVYWKYGPEPGNTSPHWYVMPASISGNTATFSITDGAQGDDDLAANGTIVDQGGPGSGPGATAVQTPTLSEWAMIVLALMMLGVAGGNLSRRRLR